MTQKRKIRVKITAIKNEEFRNRTKASTILYKMHTLHCPELVLPRLTSQAKPPRQKPSSLLNSHLELAQPAKVGDITSNNVHAFKNRLNKDPEHVTPVHPLFKRHSELNPYQWFQTGGCRRSDWLSGCDLDDLYQHKIPLLRKERERVRCVCDCAGGRQKLQTKEQNLLFC